MKELVKGMEMSMEEERIGVLEVRKGIIRKDMKEKVEESYEEMIEGGLVKMKRWGEERDVGEIVEGIEGGDLIFEKG